MSEPKARAAETAATAAGVRWWSVEDERIDGHVSASYALPADGGVVLVDPLPLAEDAQAALGDVQAICLTAACHQRSAWRLRRATGAPVHLPRGSRETDEAPDRTYGAGDELPGGLVAVHTPGPERAHYAFHRPAGDGVVFCPDLLMRDGGDGPLRFVDPAYHDDPAETRRSVERLLELPFATLCLSHGHPLTDDPRRAVRAMLAGA